MDDLESLTDEIDAVCAEELGETITYIPVGRAMLRPKAHVYYRDGQIEIGAGQLVEQDIEVHIRKVDLPGQPARGDRITLKRRPGKVWYPSNPASDDSGTHWIVMMKLVK